jgi:hypothetical protein
MKTLLVIVVALAMPALATAASAQTTIKLNLEDVGCFSFVYWVTVTPHTVTWHNDGTQIHSAVEDLGLRLFDSGPLQPGQDFTYGTFDFAGKYQWRDSYSTCHGYIALFPVLSAAANEITATVGDGPTPAGYYVEAQTRAVSTHTGWVPVGTTTQASITFPEPRGTYWVRVRLDRADGHHSGWTKAEIGVG